MIKLKKKIMTYRKRMPNQFVLLFIVLIIRRLTRIAHKNVLKPGATGGLKAAPDP